MEKPEPCLIIAGFPGIGKSHFVRENGSWLRLSDSDSSQFPKDAFPGNYIAHIKQAALENDVVFVSTHSAVIAALQAESIDFLVVAPERGLKQEYLQRYRDRAVHKDPAHGDPEAFVALLDRMWDTFHDSLEPLPNLYRLKAGQHLSDFMTIMSLIVHERLGDEATDVED